MFQERAFWSQKQQVFCWTKAGGSWQEKPAFNLLCNSGCSEQRQYIYHFWRMEGSIRLLGAIRQSGRVPRWLVSGVVPNIFLWNVQNMFVVSRRVIRCNLLDRKRIQARPRSTWVSHLLAAQTQYLQHLQEVNVANIFSHDSDLTTIVVYVC